MSINDLHWHALNYRTAAPQHVQEAWESLDKFVRDYASAVRRDALDVAVRAVRRETLEEAAKLMDKRADDLMGTLAGPDIAEECAETLRILAAKS